MDSAGVDVNIHPAKREVKFHREAEVRRLVAQAVRQTLLDFHKTDQSRQESRAPDTEHREPASYPSYPISQSSTPQLPKFPLSAPTTTPVSVPQAEQRPLNMGFAPNVSLAPNVGPSVGLASNAPNTTNSPATNLDSLSSTIAVQSPGAPVPLLSVPL